MAANISAKRMPFVSLDSKRDWDILFRIPSPAAAWRELKESCSPKTNGARLALLEKNDNVRIGVRDDPIHKLVETEDAARQLRSYGDHINLSEAQIPHEICQRPSS